ncbi:MAG: PilZ domain-containing protein [Nitrospiria bacterium]
MKNRRKSPRFQIAKMAKITRQGLREWSEVLIRDLSINGMGCSGDRYFKKEDLVCVTVKLPTETEGLIEESLTGKIAWVAQFEEEKEREFAFGIEFSDMDRQNPKLFTYLNKLGERLFTA